MSDNTLNVVSPDRPRLLEVVRERLRVKHYSIRTEKSYVGWIKRYIHFHGKRHPRDMGKAELEAFLSALAVKRNVYSPSTANAALVCAALTLPKVTAPGPLCSVQVVTKLTGAGSPSSVAMPAKVTPDASVTVTSTPALTVGSWLLPLVSNQL